MNSNDTLHAGLLAASVLGFIAIATVGTTKVQAAEQETVQTVSHEDVHVSYVRKDLSDPKAANKLYNDLRKASTRVCSASFSRDGDLASFAKYQACYRQTLHDAVKQVNAPELQTVYGFYWKGSQG